MNRRTPGRSGARQIGRKDLLGAGSKKIYSTVKRIHIAAGKCTQEQFLQWAAEARKEKLKCAAGIISTEMYLDWLKNSK